MSHSVSPPTEGVASYLLLPVYFPPEVGVDENLLPEVAHWLPQFVVA